MLKEQNIEQQRQFAGFTTGLAFAGFVAKHKQGFTAGCPVDDRVQFDQRIALVESGLAFIQPRTRRARETLRWRLPVKTGNDILA